MPSTSDKNNANNSEYYKNIVLFWTDILHLMSSKPQALASIGPMRSFVANSKKVATELVELNDDLVEFNKYLTTYYSQLADTWTEAQQKVNTKTKDVRYDAEQADAIKRLWVDIFDNDFTELFDSPKFGENYGKLVSKELELVKHWTNVTNTVLQAANLPSKEALDEVYKEIHSLKKRLRASEIEIERQRHAQSSDRVKNKRSSDADIAGKPQQNAATSLPSAVNATDNKQPNATAVASDVDIAGNLQSNTTTISGTDDDFANVRQHMSTTTTTTMTTTGTSTPDRNIANAPQSDSITPDTNANGDSATQNTKRHVNDAGLRDTKPTHSHVSDGNISKNTPSQNNSLANSPGDLTEKSVRQPSKLDDTQKKTTNNSEKLNSLAPRLQPFKSASAPLSSDDSEKPRRKRRRRRRKNKSNSPKMQPALNDNGIRSAHSNSQPSAPFDSSQTRVYSNNQETSKLPTGKKSRRRRRRSQKKHLQSQKTRLSDGSASMPQASHDTGMLQSQDSDLKSDGKKTTLKPLHARTTKDAGRNKTDLVDTLSTSTATATTTTTNTPKKEDVN